MASAKLEEVMKQAETLPSEEQLTLIADVAGRVFGGEGHLVVERSGVPVAAVISIGEYEQYRRLVAQRLHHELGREMGSEAERLGLDEAAVIALLESDRRAVYEEMYGKLGDGK